jgi:hypothetical protein
MNVFAVHVTLWGWTGNSHRTTRRAHSKTEYVCWVRVRGGAGNNIEGCGGPAIMASGVWGLTISSNCEFEATSGVRRMQVVWCTGCVRWVDPCHVLHPSSPASHCPFLMLCAVVVVASATDFEDNNLRFPAYQIGERR